MKIFSGNETPEEKIYALRSDFVTSFAIGVILIVTQYLAILAIPVIIFGAYCLCKYIQLKKTIN